MEKKTQRVTITLPIEVYQRIKEQATRDTRTIGEEITYLLKTNVATYSELYTIPTGIRSPENPTGQTYTPTNQILKRKEIH